nr:MAG TPA: Cytosine specific methyltransferase [Caudoviricetes sp.]
MKVLSLFDGMSCGQIALKQLGVIPDVYYASEIDSHAIKQTQLNFPDTVQLGDVTKWREWNIDWKSLDLILAGSPCQGFSFAGKQLAFDDPRSKLFFVFIDILNHVRSFNPNVLFPLENVNMKKSHMRVISEYCGVFPVNINSNLVSAQNRDRWYWTNIRTKQIGLFGELHSDIPQPEDKGILLRDILEEVADEKYYIKSKTMLSFIQDKWRIDKKYTQINGSKALPLLARQYQNWCGDYAKIDVKGNVSANQFKSSCFTAGAHSGGNHSDMDLILQRSRGNNAGGLFEGKTPTLSACSWEQNNMLCISSNQKHATVSLNKSTPMVSAMGMGGGHVPMITSEELQCKTDIRIRRLTPVECSRLQTIPSWYQWKCSDTQIYKMLGNGWTVDVIAHILSFMNIDNNDIRN